MYRLKLWEKTNSVVCLFEVLRPGQQFFSHFGTASWVLPVLSNEDEVSCSRTQQRAPGEDQIRNLAIKSPTLSQLSYRGSPNSVAANTRSKFIK